MDGGTEVVCVRHVPKGVTCEPITQQTDANEFSGAYCGCGGDVAEVLNQTRRPNTFMWECHKCGEVWMTRTIQEYEIAEMDPVNGSIRGLVTPAAPEGWRVAHLEEIPSAQFRSVYVTARLQKSSRFKPSVKEATNDIFYHIMHGDPFK